MHEKRMSPPMSAVGVGLLRKLADGGFHSGEALAADLGVTRARVSQLLQGAGTAGMALERVRGRGYRLVEPPRFLEAASIRNAGGLALDALAIDVVDSIDSTNSELLRRATRADIHGNAIAAEAQTAGRGRRGRAWSAVVGGSLSFSLAWRFEAGSSSLSGLSLAVGVALARALERAGFAGAELKWPNDLMYRDCKLAGVLIELSGDAQGPALAVIGIGINVHLPDAMHDSIGQPVCDLASMQPGRSIDRNALLALILEELHSVLTQYAVEGFTSFRAEWERRHSLHGKPARVLQPDGSAIDGVVAGVDAQGALLLDAGSNRLRCLSGDVSLRAAT